MAYKKGTKAADILIGTAANDILIGLGGDDLLFGGAGTDILNGGSGDDILYGGDGNDNLFGGTGNDTLGGGSGDDILNGGAGNDVMEGGSGDDRYYVNSSADTIYESEGGGIDTVMTTASFTVLSANVENMTYSGEATTFLHGNALGNVITGDSGNDHIYGHDGDDHLIGGRGADKLYGGNGNDTLEAGTGDGDELYGGEGNDVLVGTHGLDTGTAPPLFSDALTILTGGDGDDVYITYGGWDSIVEAADGGLDTVYTCGWVDGYSDTGWLGGFESPAREVTSRGFKLDENVENLIYTGDVSFHAAGNDLDNYIAGGIHSDFLDGKGGADIMVGYDGDDVYCVDNLGDVIVETASGGNDWVIVSDLETYTLGSSLENLVLEYTTNEGFGNDGNNMMYASEYTSDALYGLGGDDLLDGGRYAGDMMYGGAGDDTYHVWHAQDQVVEYSGEGVDTVISKTSFTLGDNVENLTLINHETDPVWSAVHGVGNALDNVIVGNSADNQLLGMAGNDMIDGNLGDDVITGGAGADTLTGGLGADKFVFEAVSDSPDAFGSRDVITDFGTGYEKIDLSAIDADWTTDNDDAFTFIGNNAFSGQAGELRAEFQDTLAMRVSGDVDGDGIADFAIDLDGTMSVEFYDFIL